jgi:hypothetical protein
VKDLFAKLDRATRRAHRRDLAALLACLVAGAALSFFAVFVLDYLTRFPAPIRQGLTAAILVVFGGLLPRRHRRFWPRERDPVRMARRVERRAAEAHPGGFGSLLVSAVEFVTLPALTGSAALKQTVVNKAQRDENDPAAVVLHDRRLARLAGRLLPAALLVYGLWAFLGPNALAVFLRRALGQAAEYLTRTQLVAIDYPRVSPMYERIEVRVRAAGQLPAAGRTRITFSGESPFDLELKTAAVAGLYETAIENPAKDLSFQVQLGDARSRELRIRVPKPPYVSSGSLDVEPPAYTRLGVRSLPLASADVPEHSRLRFRAQTDRPVVGCSLELGERLLPMNAVEPGGWELVDVVLTEPTQFSVRLVDDAGIENRDRIYHRLTVIPDRLPAATLEKPAQESYWAPISRLRWSVHASDDYGIAEARLLCELATATEAGKDRVSRTQEIPIGLSPDARAVRAAGELNLVELGLQPGHVLLLSLLVRDNCDFRTGKESLVSSEKHRLHIVSAEELRRIIEEEEQLVSKAVEDLAADVERQVKVLELQEKLQK